MDIIISDESESESLFDIPEVMTPYRKSISDQMTLCKARRYEVQSGGIGPEEGLPAFLYMMEMAGKVRNDTDVNDMIEDNPDQLFRKLVELEKALENLMFDKCIITGSREIVSRLRASLHLPVRSVAKVDEVPNTCGIKLIAVAAAIAIFGIVKYLND